MRTKMFAIITVCILLLAKTLLDEGCELSTTFCFASCNLLIAGCIQEILSVQRWVLWLLVVCQLALAGRRYRANGR